MTPVIPREQARTGLYRLSDDVPGLFATRVSQVEQDAERGSLLRGPGPDVGANSGFVCNARMRRRIGNENRRTMPGDRCWPIVAAPAYASRFALISSSGMCSYALSTLPQLIRKTQAVCRNLFISLLRYMLFATYPVLLDSRSGFHRRRVTVYGKPGLVRLAPQT